MNVFSHTTQMKLGILEVSMSSFKIGDFVRSDTDKFFVGIILNKSYKGWEVAWHDGDFTYGECEKTMYLYDIQPSDWTPELYQAFSDIICP